MIFVFFLEIILEAMKTMMFFADFGDHTSSELP